MPWNSTIQEEYEAMLEGNIGIALELPSDDISFGSTKFLIIIFLKWLEEGNAENLILEPNYERTYLTQIEMWIIYSMRVACCMYAERLGIFPWKLADKNIEELIPLLSINYQGFYKAKNDSIYYFENVLDLRPGPRMMDAIASYTSLALLVAFGAEIELPTTEYDMILYLIKYFRGIGWGHVINWEEDYKGYPKYKNGYYDFDIASKVKRGGCHLISNYFVALLRSYNIPSHVGRDPRHMYGHCYVHFSSINQYLFSGDNIFNACLDHIPPEFSICSDDWMSENAFNSPSNYSWKRKEMFHQYFWWCYLLTKHKWKDHDVRYLYYYNHLRDKLETLHETMSWDQIEKYDGKIPDVILPIFDDDMVDFLMDWVEMKVEENIKEYILNYSGNG